MAASRTPQYLIDTSVFIAMEQGRPTEALPEDGTWHVSVITVGELKRGILSASDPALGAQRLDTWVNVRSSIPTLEVDETVANTWGEYEAIAKGERRRAKVADSLIAATAATYGMTLVTQDRDFEWYPDLDVLVV